MTPIHLLVFGKALKWKCIGSMKWINVLFDEEYKIRGRNNLSARFNIHRIQWQISSDWKLSAPLSPSRHASSLTAFCVYFRCRNSLSSEQLVREFVGYTKQQVHWEFKQPFRQEIQHPISTHGIDKLPLVYKKFHQHSGRLQEHITRAKYNSADL